MKINIIFLLVLLPFTSYSQSSWVNIRDHGAIADGSTSNTTVFKTLIDSVAESGGGTIFIPAGTYLTGPIIMQSNITLYLDAGAMIRFSDDFDEYLPMVQSRWEDVRVKTFVSPIYAYRCNNIAIRGDGHIDGQGKKWWDFWNQAKFGKPADTKWQKIFREENAALLAKNKYLQDKNAFLRPSMITTYECNNVLIEGISLSNPPFWTIMPTFSDNITIEGITIENPEESPNTDGIDLSSCTNVRISNCHLNVGDDCIVIKSGRDEDGREAGRPTENLTITNCTMLKGHGGVVIGSEMSGNVKRVAISNCVFEGTDVGIRIKTMRGRGGIVEDVRVSNIVMYNMVKEGVIITMRYQPTPSETVSERTPAVRNVHLSDIVMRNANRAIAIYGLAERQVEQVSFTNFDIHSRKGILIEDARDINFQNISLESTEGILFEAKDSELIGYDRVQLKAFNAEKPPINFVNCQHIRITNCFQPESIKQLVAADEMTSELYFLYNILPGTSTLTSGKRAVARAEFNILKQ